MRERERNRERESARKRARESECMRVTECVCTYARAHTKVRVSEVVLYHISFLSRKVNFAKL